MKSTEIKVGTIGAKSCGYINYSHKKTAISNETAAFYNEVKIYSFTNFKVSETPL